MPAKEVELPVLWLQWILRLLCETDKLVVLTKATAFMRALKDHHLAGMDGINTT